MRVNSHFYSIQNCLNYFSSTDEGEQDKEDTIVEVNSKTNDVTKPSDDVTEIKPAPEFELPIVHSSQNIFDLQTGDFLASLV